LTRKPPKLLAIFPAVLLFGGVGAGLVACDAAPARDVAVDAWEVPLAITDCAQAPQRGIPTDVDRLVVEIRDPTGVVAPPQVFTRAAGELDGGDLLLQGIPAGEGVRLTLYGCGPDASGVAEVKVRADLGPFGVEDDGKYLAPVRFHRAGRLSCTGADRGPDFAEFAGMGVARAFPAWTSLRSGNALLLGGAQAVEQVGGAPAGLSGAPAVFGYDVYAPGESLFWGGAARTTRVRGALPTPRVGAAAATLTIAGRETVLLVGGAPAVSWNALTGALGPLEPRDGALSQPFVQGFDVASEAFVQVLGQERLSPRFRPAVGRGASGVLLAGGTRIEPDGTYAASNAVELLTPAGLRAAVLDTSLAGASATPLPDGSFLLWGGNVSAPDAPARRVRELEGALVVAPVAVSAAPGVEWEATAFHAAVRLPNDAQGSTRVLVVGGLGMRDGKTENNPRPADPARRALVLALPADGGALEVRRPSIAPEALEAVARAYQEATQLQGGAVIAGGWQTANQLDASADLVFWEADAANAAAGRLVVRTVAADPTQPAAGGVTQTMTRRRVGHVLIRSGDDTVLIAGGLDGVAATHTAEVYLSPQPAEACALGAEVAGAPTTP
jgi:hypothetical protein